MDNIFPFISVMFHFSSRSACISCFVLIIPFWRFGEVVKCSTQKHGSLDKVRFTVVAP